MDFEDYLPRIRASFRLFIEAAQQEDNVIMRTKAENALAEIVRVVTEIVQTSQEHVVGAESRRVLNEIAYVLGFQNGDMLKLALGIQEEKRPEHIPPPPP